MSAYDKSGKDSQKIFRLRVNSPKTVAAKTSPTSVGHNSERSKILTRYKGKLTEGNYITFGTSKKEVLRIQGDPFPFNPEVFSSLRWNYDREYADYRGLSRVYIEFNRDGKVKSWFDSDGVLKTGVVISRVFPINKTLTVGSDTVDVLLIQGLPYDSFTKNGYREKWNYDREYADYRGLSRAYIEFDRNGKVKSWFDTAGDVLKVKWTP